MCYFCDTCSIREVGIADSDRSFACAIVLSYPRNTESFSKSTPDRSSDTKSVYYLKSMHLLFVWVVRVWRCLDKIANHLSDVEDPIRSGSSYIVPEITTGELSGQNDSA